MTVDIEDSVDSMDYDPAQGADILIIADHLPWGDKSHFRLLHKKIQWYMTVIESDYGSNSERQRSAIIQLMCRYLPDERAKIS